MPRRNAIIIFLVAVVSFVCYRQMYHNPYGRYLSQALSLIDERALERIPPHQLFDSAMRGIVGELNKGVDENSSYISAKELAEFEADLNQKFGGVGVTIKLEGAEPKEGEKLPPRKLMVVNPPLPGTPAEKAGIRAHDEITAIDDQPTAQMTMNDVIGLMRGEVGSQVKLDVLHAGEHEPVPLTITRDAISVPSVIGDRQRRDGSWDFQLQQDPRLGYVRITTFGDDTVHELQLALHKLAEKKVSGLIIDLRDDSGGRLDAAVEICSMFLHKDDLIVSIRGRNGQLEEEYRAPADGPYVSWPLAVLINGHSASASEIVSACLQDHDRAVVVGTRSYGKGTVQHLLRIESGRSRLKLTAAKYWRPSEQDIHRIPDAKDEDTWGVSPDEGYVVPLTKDQEIRLYKERSRRDLVEPTPQTVEPGSPPDPDFNGPADPQIQKAIETLQHELARDAAKARAA